MQAQPPADLSLTTLFAWDAGWEGSNVVEKVKDMKPDKRYNALNAEGLVAERPKAVICNISGLSRIA